MMSELQIAFETTSDIQWPPRPAQQSSSHLEMLFQLDQTQWWAPDRIEWHQFIQLRHLALNAIRHVPFYQSLDAELFTSEDPREIARTWSGFPLLTRRDIQTAQEALVNPTLAPEHGATTKHFTGGSTGQPVMTLGTGTTNLIWEVMTLRDHQWHRRDYAEMLATIRYVAGGDADDHKGTMTDNWGHSTRYVTQTGPCVALTTNCDVVEQARWLQEHDPGYLLTYPTIAYELAKYFIDQGETLRSLREVRTFGEIVEPRVRLACREAWGVKLVDVYSSQEVGYIAIQCPECENYHVQSETILVEVLDEDGNACDAGDVGKVVVTPMQNFAMPLIRYDIGDYAEVGEPCECGRGLPVLKRVLGRQRNMLVLPDGSRRWPSSDADDPGDTFARLPCFYQMQVIQRSLDLIEALLVVPRPLTEDEERKIRDYLHHMLRYPFQIRLLYVDEIARSPTGKFEDFRSEVCHTIGGH